MVSIKGRIAGTVIIIFCWLIFTISFLAFYPTGFDIWQNIAFLIVSGLVASGAVGLLWISLAF